MKGFIQTQGSLKIGVEAAYAYFYRWGFFFRIFGWGAAIQRDLPILFSERNGYRRRARIGRWAFSFLRRGK